MVEMRLSLDENKHFTSAGGQCARRWPPLCHSGKLAAADLR
jgi:predicted lipoprotein with Yx(FWY)xxD motif